jgi:hypothetical protein
MVGLYKSVYCDLEFTDKGRTVRQSSGYGQIRIDPARGGRKK